MCKRVLALVIAGSFAANLTSCGKWGDDAPDTPVKLTAAEVSSLLGITGSDGLEVGDVTTGRDGVTVKSISLKEGASTEVEVKDVELHIKSTSKMVYAISSLKIGTLDVIDWKSTQRVRAFGIRVDQPGDKFLTKLEAAIAAVRSGGSLRTADLACARLSIDRVDYEVRSGEGKPTRVRLESFAIDQATSETIGELSIDRIGLGDAVAVKGLKVTRVDRLWADQMLGLLMTLSSADSPSSRPADAAYPPAPKSPALAKRLLPFDRIELGAINVDIGKLSGGKASGTARVSKLHLDVQRGADGRFAGLTGGVDAAVATSAFGKEGAKFFRDMGNPSLEESLAGSATITMVLDPAQRAERSTMTIKAPGLATLSATAMTRQVPELLGKLLAQEEIPSGLVTIASLAVEAHDGGLFAFLSSDRYKERALARRSFEEIPFQERYAAESDRLRKELKSFFRSPKDVAWTAGSDGFIAASDFLTQAGGTDRAASVTTHWSFTSGPSAVVSAAPRNAATLRSDYAAYKAASKPYDNQYIGENGFDKVDGWMQAAQGGSVEAQVLVANCYESGRGRGTDYAEAMRWFRKAADAGNPIAMRQVGYMYENEYGVKKDKAEAISWYRRAADAGDVWAMYSLGSAYRYADDAEAFRWYKKSADQGNASGMSVVGHLYRDGKGVPKDDVEAVRWYRKAADAGDEYAICSVAESYETGKGVPKDPAEALRWYRKAADAGNYSARAWLEKNAK